MGHLTFLAGRGLFGVLCRLLLLNSPRELRRLGVCVRVCVHVHFRSAAVSKRLQVRQSHNATPRVPDVLVWDCMGRFCG